MKINFNNPSGEVNPKDNSDFSASQRKAPAQGREFDQVYQRKEPPGQRRSSISHEHEHEEHEYEADHKTEEKRSVSPFDLSKEKKANKDKPANKAAIKNVDANKKDSEELIPLKDRKEIKGKDDDEIGFAIEEEVLEEDELAKDSLFTKTQNASAQAAKELHPPVTSPSNIQQTNSNTSENVHYASPQMVEQIPELIEKFVERVQVMETQGEVETTVTLKNGIFNEARLVVTTQDTAPGEFNIKFENLTPEAQKIIAMQDNQGALRSALDQKGFTVHIIVATTQSEQPTFVQTDNRQQQQQGNQGQGQGGGKGQGGGGGRNRQGKQDSEPE